MNKKQLAVKAAAAAADCFFPRRCPVCDKCVHPEDGLIHPGCRKLLESVSDPYCLKCGRQISSVRQEFCSQCRKNMPVFTQGRSLFSYQGAMKGCMYRLKYNNKREYARFFAEEAEAQLGKWLERTGAECIVPVPMYRKKQKLRGYNQAESLAWALSISLNLPVEKKLVYRKRETKALKTLNPLERRQELEDAFAVCREYTEGEKRYSSLLLVDDIYTTGATAEAVTETLKKAGIQNVWVLCAASARGNN